MVHIPRRLRRRLTSLGAVFLLLFTIYHLLLSPDSTFRLAIHFNGSRLYNAIRATVINKDGWLQTPGQYPIDLRHDVGYLIKTGYGTRHRVPAQLNAFSVAGDFLGEEGESFLVVGDWTSVNKTDAEAVVVEIHDAIKTFIETKVEGSLLNHARLQKYQVLQEAVESGDEDWALNIGQSYGWELDALKFITGMELLYEKIPNKKWYVILDDDTFVIKASLELLLSHLDPKKPQYIGNAVGDFRGRFAHGGSGVLISGAAMDRLFGREDVIMRAYLASLDEKWGDKLVATTLQRLGIYIDERYNHHFNGEPPEITRITRERFCSPIIGFHGLRKPGAMQAVGRAIGTGPSATNPVLWGELWQIFGAEPIQKLAEQPVQKGQDHVGPTDDKVSTREGVPDAEGCRTRCMADGRCLAWTYEEGSHRCHMSEWMVIGADGAEGKWSGVNWEKVDRMLWECS